MNEMQLFSQPTQMMQTKKELARCNQITQRFGLTLSETQMENLAVHRFEALEHTGRVEFEEGILGKLIVTFCDSPYIQQSDYEPTLITLQELFYSFKKDCMEQVTDDELLKAMRLIFDEAARGSLEYLADTDRDTLYIAARTGSLHNTILEESIDWEETDD